MNSSKRQLLFGIVVAICVLLASGCIRFFGKAAYVKKSEKERTERVVGFDTEKLFDSQKSSGSINT